MPGLGMLRVARRLFDANFHKFGCLEVFGVKNIGFSLIFGFFGGSSHMLSDWCLGYVIKVEQLWQGADIQ